MQEIHPMDLAEDMKFLVPSGSEIVEGDKTEPIPAGEQFTSTDIPTVDEDGRIYVVVLFGDEDGDEAGCVRMPASTETVHVVRDYRLPSQMRGSASVPRHLMEFVKPTFCELDGCDCWEGDGSMRWTPEVPALRF